MNVTDPLFRHLMDIASDPDSSGLILAGGYGISVKQSHLQKTGERLLIASMPPARATADLDFFLQIHFFEQGRTGIRRLLDRLGYEEVVPRYQFLSKPQHPGSETGRIKVDLLSRDPTPNEGTVHVKPPRVGTGANIGIHGQLTPEAFAVEEQPILVHIAGPDTMGVERGADILVPHPYAWINMKVMATHDWELQNQGKLEAKRFSERHAFDVYLLLAMLTPSELRLCADLAAKYANLGVALKIRSYATGLFARPDSPGSVEASRQAGSPIAHATVWEALQQVLGIT